jgi:hypothetical protein
MTAFSEVRIAPVQHLLASPAGIISVPGRDRHSSGIIPMLGTFSTRFSALVGAPPGVYRRRAARVTSGMPSCVAKWVSGPIRNREVRLRSRA